MKIFLAIDGIPGESTDDKHKDEIEVESFSWGEMGVPPSAGGGGPTGPVQMQGFTFSMRVSKASPLLFLAAATNQHFSTAVVTVRATDAQSEFLTWTLSDVFVSDFRTSGSTAGAAVTETATLAFAKIQTEYRELLPTGQPGPSVTAGWDLAQNRPL